jgi:small conductance mechanosensitive channel
MEPNQTLEQAAVDALDEAVDAAEDAAATVDRAAEQTGDPEAIIEAAAADAGEQLQRIGDGLARGEVDTAAVGVLTTNYLAPALLVILLLIVAYLIGKFLARLSSAPVSRRVDETLGKFIGKVVFYAVMIGAVLGVLQYVGIGVASFAAIIAAAGFAVGLAFQGTLSNFSAGIMLLTFRPFKVGHVINAAGVVGKVDEIDLFTTTLDTPDNRRLIVPNSAIFGSTIENISFHGERRVDVNVGVEYRADIDRTREVLAAAAATVPGLIEGDGRGFAVVLGDLSDSAVTWTVRVWVPAASFFAAREALTRAIKMHLDQAGIGIPFPQMDVHLDAGDGEVVVKRNGAAVNATPG